MSFRVGVNPTSPTEVFRDGVGAYRHYRIPSLVTTPSNVVLALAEGRMQKNDHGWVDIVLRRSFDGGETWSPMSVVHTESNATHRVTIGNPTPLVDAPEVVLLLNRENAEVLLTRSLDDGATWSPPRQISWSRPPEWQWLAVGPPAALRTRAGRWVVPADGFVGHSRFYTATSIFSFVLLSDDRGETWRSGSLLDGGNECQAAERADGSLVLNMRSRDAVRLLSFSHDGGDTWSPPTQGMPGIQDGNCQGSMIAARGGRILLATSVGHGRTELRLHASADGGGWARVGTLEPGKAGYSALAALPPEGVVRHVVNADGGSAAADDGDGDSGAEGERIGCLFEASRPPEGDARRGEQGVLVLTTFTAPPPAVVPFEYDGVVQSSVRPRARVSTDYQGPAVGPYVEVDDENVEAIMAEWEAKGGAKAESRPARMNWADEM